EGQGARAPGFSLDHGGERGDAAVEAAAPPVLFVRALRRAVDRERHLVYPGMYQPPRLLVGERKPVRARVQVHLREMRLDVLAHLDGALVEERLAVVDEVDAHQRRAGLVDDPAEQVEIEHAGLTGPRDAG